MYSFDAYHLMNSQSHDTCMSRFKLIWRKNNILSLVIALLIFKEEANRIERYVYPFLTTTKTALLHESNSMSSYLRESLFEVTSKH